MSEVHFSNKLEEIILNFLLPLTINSKGVMRVFHFQNYAIDWISGQKQYERETKFAWYFNSGILLWRFNSGPIASKIALF